jgi:signal transduction histidine kinase
VTLRDRLTLWFAAIALGAIGVIYLWVVPQLEDALLEQRLRTLSSVTQRYAPSIERAIDANADTEGVDKAVRAASEDASARVTLLGVNRGTEGLQTWLKSDSTRQVEIRDLQFPVALEAARSGKVATGTEAGSGGRVGEVALPLFFDDTRSRRKLVGSVVVFSAPLEDVEGSVAVIRERMLAAALIALLAATIAGLVVARTLARRVKRLEEVAWRVAEGDFGARFPIDSPDELGQLARALGDMQRQLAELDSARKRFIATASHELRTPIFSLGGFVELLEDDDVPEEDRARFLEQLRVQVDRLGKLATDLLDLSRLEAGSLELRPERTDIGQLARAVTSEFEPGLAGHDSKLEVRLPPDPVSAVCDPERVAQVMRILLDNALTHTPAGTDVVVSVSERGDVVRLGVGDFGPGIHRSMLPRVFEPFVTTDDARGSGLGLAIAHELAERMKGRLVVESQPGRTTFTLELPA